MLQISRKQMDRLQDAQVMAFIKAQPSRLRERWPAAYGHVFADDDQALACVAELVTVARAAGVADRDNMELLLDTCIDCGWTTPASRQAAGINAILANPAPSGVEKVTLIVNAGAFAKR